MWNSVEIVLRNWSIFFIKLRVPKKRRKMSESATASEINCKKEAPNPIQVHEQAVNADQNSKENLAQEYFYDNYSIEQNSRAPQELDPSLVSMQYSHKFHNIPAAL
jgi:hypothetical protein